MNEIINNNYSIYKNFDSMPDMRMKKYLSKKQASILIKEYKSSRLISYSVIRELAIVGIVKFNDDEAYIFNRTPNFHNVDVSITCSTFSELQECYVFKSMRVDKTIGKKLEQEYYNRGGKVFEYYEYQEKFIRPVNNELKEAFKQSILENIFKHGFSNPKKNTFKKDNIIIKVIDTSVGYLGGGSCSIMDLDIKHDTKVLINSTFSKFAEKTVDYSGDLKKICIRCVGSKNSEFMPFLIEIDS